MGARSRSARSSMDQVKRGKQLRSMIGGKDELSTAAGIRGLERRCLISSNYNVQPHLCKNGVKLRLHRDKRPKFAFKVKVMESLRLVLCVVLM